MNLLAVEYLKVYGFYVIIVDVLFPSELAPRGNSGIRGGWVTLPSFPHELEEVIVIEELLVDFELYE